jgi:hypothetical protein
MHTFFILGALCAAAFAAPVTHSLEHRADTDATWSPAAGSKTLCDKTSDKIIGFYVGPQMETVLTDACAAMMPPCAYPDRLPNDTVCVQVMDWPLDGPKYSTQSANVETLEGNKISGWDVKCKYPKNPLVSADVLTTYSLGDASCTDSVFAGGLLDSAGLLWILRVHAAEDGTGRLPHSERLWYRQHHGRRGQSAGRDDVQGRNRGRGTKMNHQLGCCLMVI